MAELLGEVLAVVVTIAGAGACLLGYACARMDRDDDNDLHGCNETGAPGRRFACTPAKRGMGQSPMAEQSGNLDAGKSRPRSASLPPLGCLLAILTLCGCETAGTTVEPRALTKGNYMPLCIALCQITTALTSHEGNYGEGPITSTQSGGTATATQTKTKGTE